MIKNNIYIAILACLLVVLSSCEKFLDVQAKNQLVVSSLDDVEKILGGYLIAPSTNTSNSVNASGNATSLNNYYGSHHCSDEFSFYQWGKTQGFNYIGQQRYERLADFKSDFQGDFIWSTMYKTIGIMNSVIIEVQNITKGSQRQKDYLMGEAYTWRAYCYLKLVQYYVPYYEVTNFPGDVEARGVPLVTNSYAVISDIDLSRATQNKNYELILSDLKEALIRIQRSSPESGFNMFFNKRFINGLLAKVYWYKALSPAKEETDWANAEKYATDAIEGRTLTSDLDGYRNIFNTGNKEPSNNECPLRIVTFDPSNNISFQLLRTQPTDISYTLFTDNDIRKNIFHTASNFIMDPAQLGTVFLGFTQNKYQVDLFSGNIQNGWWSEARLSEMYLVKAEAVQRQGGNARSLLDEFQAKRYLTGQPVTSSDVLNDILLERRKEFMYELDHRWVDSKRLAIPVTRTIDGETYSLDGKDYRYTLKIPDQEILLNPVMKQNPGWIN